MKRSSSPPRGPYVAPVFAKMLFLQRSSNLRECLAPLGRARARANGMRHPPGAIDLRPPRTSPDSHAEVGGCFTHHSADGC